MAAKGLVGMDRVVLADRERPIFIEPMGLGLRGITLPARVRSEAKRRFRGHRSATAPR
jgi:non-homologous end joining protein Ku